MSTYMQTYMSCVLNCHRLQSSTFCECDERSKESGEFDVLRTLPRAQLTARLCSMLFLTLLNFLFDSLLNSYILDSLLNSFIFDSLLNSFILDSLLNSFILDSLLNSFIFDSLLNSFILDSLLNSF